MSAMDPLLENSLTRPRRTWRERRKASRFERWAKSPIIAYRATLTAVYALTIYFGIAGLVAGIPAFETTSPTGFVAVWAALVIIGSIAATIGSIHSEQRRSDGSPTPLAKRFRNIELAGAWLLFLSIGSYAAVLTFLAYGDGDVDRMAASAGFTVLGATPGGRMVWLMAQLGRR